MAKIDKDLKRLQRLETGVQSLSRQLVPVGIAVTFLAMIGVAAGTLSGVHTGWALFVAASIIGGYMALNIGANDVANNMSPAVGSRALTITTAVIAAAIFEAAGAIIAGGEVVSTVASGIINPEMMPSSQIFAYAMMSALLAAALWINLATWLGAPVSTTHSIVGAVLGAGIVVAGFEAADWSVIARIVASWVISPVTGGLIAAGFLFYIDRTILDRKNKLEAARFQVPILVGIMAGTFSTYLILKGLARIMPTPLELAVLAGAAIGVASWFLVRPFIARTLEGKENRKASVGELFTIPVICGACLLSFAHGSNDVANAIGPLAAIYMAITEGVTDGAAPLPTWILLIGALGISLGLLLFGPKLIRTVGSKITKLNRVRAYCVTLSAGITVIIASTLGMPVSSTHVAIGALFGVGFLREGIANNGKAKKKSKDKDANRKTRYLVRRGHVVTIVSAWVITVPATGLLSAAIAFTMTVLF